MSCLPDRHRHEFYLRHRYHFRYGEYSFLHYRKYRIWFHSNYPFFFPLSDFKSHTYFVKPKKDYSLKGENLLSIFGISDLHLSFSTDKPMDIFHGWDNHTQRLKANWNRLVDENDTVVLSGDLSWALKLQETEKDFEFLKALNGKKILLKGNHDLWWSTARKINTFFEEKEIDDCKILFNDCIIAENYAIAGTRGWFYDNSGSKKVLLREAGRLETSLKYAVDTGLPPLVFLHYPPVYGEYVCREILDVLQKYSITDVYHGHIHGSGFNKAVKEFEGVSFHLISCDCIDFTPLKIK